MATGLQNAWSTTPASNATADTAINAREGMAPSEVNNAVRAMMAQIKKAVKDWQGGLVTGGSSTAYTLTTNETITLVDGVRVSCRMHATNGASPTLNVDSTGALPIQSVQGVAVSSAALAEGGIYSFTYYSSSAAWIVESGGSTSDTFVSVSRYGAIGDGVTDDTTAAQAAITAAVAGGFDLFWPGTYLTTASLDDFHSVRHWGPGAIKRGSDLFHVEAKSTTTNKLYVSTTGTDTNDGLSSSQPMDFQTALDATKNYRWPLRGTWQIKLAAGTYDAPQYTVPTGLRAPNRLQIIGPSVGGHPNVPTAIIDGGGASVGGIFGARVDVQVQDVKVIDCLPSTGGGVLVQDGSDLYAVNFHASGCTDAVRAANGGTVRVQGGLFDSNETGATFNSNVTYTLGYNAGGSLSAGTQITNSTLAGLVASEGSKGHADYTTIDNCNRGIDLQISSRCDIVGSDIKNNVVGLRARYSSNFINNTGTTWTGNTVRWQIESGSSEANLHNAMATEFRAAASTSSFSHTGDTTATDLATLYTVPAGWFLGDAQRQKIKVVAYGTKTNGGSPGAVAVKLKLGGTVIDTLTQIGTAAGNWKAEWEIWATGSSAQSFKSLWIQSNNSNRVNTGTSAIDMTSDQDIVVAVQLGNSGDTAAMVTYEVWITG